METDRTMTRHREPAWATTRLGRSILIAAADHRPVRAGAMTSRHVITTSLSASVTAPRRPLTSLTTRLRLRLSLARPRVASRRVSYDYVQLNRRRRPVPPGRPAGELAST